MSAKQPRPRALRPSEPSLKPSDVLQVGYVARAHGLTGEVAIRTFDPKSEVLQDVERVRLRMRDGLDCDFVVDSVRGAKNELLMGLEGVSDRTHSDRLVGATVFVFRDELAPPGEGEYFQGDLVGLAAVDVSGNSLGKVEEIWNTGPVPNLVIRGQGQPELIVPFVDAFVPEVDMAQGRIVIVPPEIAP